MSQDNDPWGPSPKNTSGNDINAVFNPIKKLLGLDNKKSGDGGKEPHANLPDFNPKTIVIGTLAAFGVWFVGTGVYVVKEGSRGVETIFGKHSSTVDAGLNWNWPYPIGEAEVIDVLRVENLVVGTSSSSKNSVEGQMLSSDENIVEIGLAVQYRIGKPEDYLFKVNEPEVLLKESTMSSIREVVGANTMDEILTKKRSVWPDEVKQILRKNLEIYNAGIDVLSVELREAKAPQEVQDAFDDVVKAREDAERFKQEAEAYRNEKVPIARGLAGKVKQQAEGYKEAVIAQAEGEANRFLQVLSAYEKAPEITRDRLYIETMQKVYSKSSNVIIDTEGTNAPILYLNTDKAAQAAPVLPPLETISNKPYNTNVSKPVKTKDDERARESLRTRGRN